MGAMIRPVMEGAHNSNGLRILEGIFENQVHRSHVCKKGKVYC